MSEVGHASGWSVWESPVDEDFIWDAWTPMGHRRGKAPTENLAEQAARAALRELEEQAPPR